MNGLARVSVDTGVVFLPVETPYDQDVLFEYLRSMASTHREVEVELARLRVLVGQSGAHRHDCAGCRRLMAHGAVRYVIARRALCGRCARACVREAEREIESPAERGEHEHHGGEEREITESRDHLRL